jgi:hypothetical protein
LINIIIENLLNKNAETLANSNAGIASMFKNEKGDELLKMFKI